MVIPGLSVMTVADLLQLPPVRRNLIFLRFLDKDSINHLLGLQLYHLFEYAELTEVVIENDKLYVDLLKKVWVGNTDDVAERLLKARFIHESISNYPKDVFHIYTANESATKRNYVIQGALHNRG